MNWKSIRRRMSWESIRHWIGSFAGTSVILVILITPNIYFIITQGTGLNWLVTGFIFGMWLSFTMAEFVVRRPTEKLLEEMLSELENLLKDR